MVPRETPVEYRPAAAMCAILASTLLGVRGTCCKR